MERDHSGLRRRWPQSLAWARALRLFSRRMASWALRRISATPKPHIPTGSMILTCPECATRYQTDAALFVPDGRTVRCAKCSHVWHQAAPEDEPVLAPDEEVADTNSGTSSRCPSAVPMPAHAKRQDRDAGTRTLARAIRFCAGLARSRTHHFRDRLVGAALPAGHCEPVAAILLAVCAVGMKVNTVGIELDDATFHHQTEDGEDVLAISGKLVNITAHELSVPQIRVTLSDDERRELYHWNFQPHWRRLRPNRSRRSSHACRARRRGRAISKCGLPSTAIERAARAVRRSGDCGARRPSPRYRGRRRTPSSPCRMLSGAFVFAADLLRALARAVSICPSNSCRLSATARRGRRGNDIRGAPAPGSPSRGRACSCCSTACSTTATRWRALALLLTDRAPRRRRRGRDRQGARRCGPRGGLRRFPRGGLFRRRLRHGRCRARHAGCLTWQRWNKARPEIHHGRS